MKNVEINRLRLHGGIDKTGGEKDHNKQEDLQKSMVDLDLRKIQLHQRIFDGETKRYWTKPTSER